MDAVRFLDVPSWRDVPGLVHGFFGRSGGASTGPYASLNVSDRVGDDPNAVWRNRQRVRDALGGLDLTTMEQVHGTRVVRVEAAGMRAGPADGIYSGEAGIGLAVTTADCVPILIVAPERRLVAAVHAGWRGTLAGIARVAVTTLKREMRVCAAELRVALGPCIGPCCYEVEAKIGVELEDRWGRMPDAWRPAGAHGQLDLRATNHVILEQAGVERGAIHDVGPCTACAGDRFFSHRSSGGRSGRQIAVVGWRPGDAGANVVS